MAGSTVTATPASTRPRAIFALVRRQQQELAMWPTTTPAAPVLLGELAHLVHVQAVRGGPDVEVDVDVGVVLGARQLEDALDLRRAVRVVARRAADHLRAALHDGLDQQLVGARVIGQPLLRNTHISMSMAHL